jgi:CheY-like chemotaxis protein/rubrerythrin
MDIILSMSKNMSEIIIWLLSIEKLSVNLYRSAAGYFDNDDKLLHFLLNLAEDEAQHYALMESVGKFMRDSGRTYEAAITLDEITRLKIEKPFVTSGKKMSNGTLTVADMMECIKIAEFSEWNDIFLYVMDTVVNENADFGSMARTMKTHKHKIEAFINPLLSISGVSDREIVRKLPSAWKKNILVVDDEMSIVNLLAAILEDKGFVQSAENGQAALDKLSNQYFDVIISDVNMPIMGGIELYNQALTKFPGIGEKFIFFSGVTDERRQFFRENNLTSLTKPAPISLIEEAVDNILNQS